ncbi:hypothetical protein Ocin01_17789 [Orchesella cincta]|uniref:Uncharacterized protein n=1 Tax=Orchesella cincta TaxID=48709 RepID=A0A1D2M7I9_ORCCI|nr:hypothetical protein Ocin01_17789 [Orchesella cincta]
MDEVFVRVGELADRHNQSMATTATSSKATGISALPTQLQSEHVTVADDQERLQKNLLKKEKGTEEEVDWVKTCN